MKNTNYLKEELYELIKSDESIFDFIQESSLDGLWYWDLEHPEEEWMNPKFWHVLGYDHREMPHKASAWQNIIHPEDLKLATENFIKHCENPDYPYDQTVRYTHKNGSTVWIRCRGLAIRDKHGKPQRMLGAHQEITALKNKEVLLQKNTNLLRNAQKISKIGSWELDLTTNEVFWTEELYKIYDLDPTLPPPLYDEQEKLFTPKSWELLTSSVSLALEQHIPYELELTTIRKDGSHGWMWVRGEAVFDENKNITGLRGVAQDISEKKALELEKEALIKRLHYALDASGDGIWDWTPFNGITVFSKAWIEMLGYEVGDLPSLASEWSDRLHPDDIEWVFAAISKVTETPENGDIFSHEYRFKNKAGDYLWILNKAKVVERNEQGQATRVVGTHTNITKEKDALIQIEEARGIAEAANKAKSEFLANMSHEIRTPMNGIYGILQLLKGEQLSEKGRSFISKAEYSCKNLLTIINDILDFSRVEAGLLDIESTPFNLKNVIERISSDMLPLAIDKKISFEVNNFLTHDRWMGDSVRVGQVILNLVANAIKFTEQGKVTLSLSSKHSSSSDNIVIEIVDTGIGMDNKALEKLFSRFSQADDSITRKYGGTGLGMSITQSLVNLMKGQISVDSEVGKGTTIQIILPLEKAYLPESDFPHESESSLDLTGKYILIAEDNAINQAIIEAVLEPFNATLTMVANGEEAVQSALSKRPDLILMDIQMPVKDGVAACQEILAHMNDVPIVALTANVMAQDIENYLKKGFVAHLGKPFEVSLLKEKLKHLLLDS
ncbi:MAG: PAS domain S-box-containing protein [Glaciecola sp.]|jgi:PAS domain S-box-containing protein